MIRVAYSTIHAYDKYLLSSKKNEAGYVPGAEGSGMIIAVGEGVSPSHLGRKCCFLHNAWASHAVKKAHSMDLILLDDQVDFKNAAIAYINPLTAIAMLDVIKQKNQKSLISNAAAS